MTKTVGLSMRLDYTEHGEARISVDQAWLPLLTGLDFFPLMLPFGGRNAFEYVEILKPQSIILTGGNDILEGGISYSKERNEFEFNLLDYAAENAIPVLGVCRGMQIMNLHGKGSVEETKNHTNKNHSLNWMGQNIDVNSFHNFIITPGTLSVDYIVDAIADDGSIEAFHHKKHNWAGVMWHPERDIPNKDSHYAWIKNFLDGESL